VFVNNVAGRDLFGFDKCVLTFDATNWNVGEVWRRATKAGTLSVQSGSLRLAPRAGFSSMASCQFLLADQYTAGLS
jgi:hypothetical protein